MNGDPSLPLQTYLRTRLISAAAMTALVPAQSIFDRSGRPEMYPCVVIGDGQTTFDRYHSTVYADLHVWSEETGLMKAKAIGAAIIASLEDMPWPVTGFFVSDLRVASARYLRDPAGYSHGVLSYEAIMQQRSVA